MREHLNVIATISLALASFTGFAGASAAQPNSVTAIDIALEPDATMIEHAMTANARLLKAFPKGFALDATHHPHVSMSEIDDANAFPLSVHAEADPRGESRAEGAPI